MQPAELKPRARAFARVLLAIAVGMVIGYSIPTVSIVHRDRFGEARNHVLNTLNGGILGAVVGVLLEYQRDHRIVMPRHPVSRFLLLVTTFTALCAVVDGYLAIVNLHR